MLKKLSVFAIFAVLACVRTCAVEIRDSRTLPGEVTVEQIDGEEVVSFLTRISPAEIVLDKKANGGGEAKTIPIKEIAKIRFPGALSSGALSSPLVALRNGDSLAQVTIVSATDTKMKLKTSWLDEFELEYKAVDALVFYGGSSKKMPDGLDAILKTPPPKEDLLVTIKGESISGFYEKLNDKEVSFNAGGQSRAYPYDQIAALRLAVTEKYEPNKAFTASLTLVDGSRLSVKPVGVEEGHMKIEALDGQAFRIHQAGIVSLVFGGGRLVYLSALKPTSVDEKPYVGGAAFVFTWRRDRSSANGPLKIGGTVYEKGLGVHSYCKLVYNLNGEYAKFMSDVGMDASAPPKAVCAWKVLVDGKESAGGTASAGGEKTVVKIDVAGAKQLELICDYGPDDDDAGDRLDFGKARLIKP